MILSYRYRINPTKAQSTALTEMLADFCQLYNAALDHRIGAYRRGVSINFYDQSAAMPEIRRDLPHQGRWSATAQLQVLRKLDKSYQAFFRRVKLSGKAGFPRFRSRERYHAADFKVSDGLTLRKNGRIGVVGIPGEIKVRWHRALPSKPKTAILSRNGGKWFVIFHVEAASADRASPNSVGIDMGITTLVALSTGETVARPNFTKRMAGRLRVKQRALARCKRGSKGRRKRKAALAKCHSHLAASRRDFLHKESRKIVNRFGRIAVEYLNIKGLAAGMLAKSVNDASWGELVLMLRYKAENAGCEFVEVDPRGTSQTCPECGIIAAKTLNIRVHNCECGCVLDRDVAAAKIVHLRAFGCLPGMGSGQSTLPVAA